MAVPFNDARVRGGDNDPAVQDATPGCVFRFSPGVVGGTGQQYDLAQSSSPLRRLTQRIPPVWVEGAANAYLANVRLADNLVRVVLSTQVADPNDGSAQFTADLTAAAVAGWGVVAFDTDGTPAYFTLADVAAGDSAPGNPYTANINAVGRANLDTSDRSGWSLVVVDRNHPNVVWNDREFVSVRAGAGFNLGNDRMLRALTAGALHLELHSGSPPTTANRITGGGYGGAAITGPAGWQLSTDAGLRVIQNTAAAGFGTATNVWTRAVSIGLWTAPNAGGDLLWHDVILAFTARSGATPSIPPRALKIGLPNLG